MVLVGMFFSFPSSSFGTSETQETILMEESNTVPAALYHYTTIDAFKNIFASRMMRATRYDLMNDTSEIQLGVTNMIKAIADREVNPSWNAYKQFLITGLQGFREGGLSIFVLSFSSEPDSLDQWRAYTPKGGVAIGFDFAKVQKGFMIDITRRVGGTKVGNPIQPDRGNPLLQCVYTDKSGSLADKSFVDVFFSPNSYPAMFVDHGREPMQTNFFYASLSVMIYRRACSIKHGVYASEKEWRYVNFRPDADDYPVKLNDANRFYIEFPFEPKEFVKEIWISPHGDVSGFERAVNFVKQEHDLAFVIKTSDIPFRA